jgi:hypothetical protein
MRKKSLLCTHFFLSVHQMFMKATNITQTTVSIKMFARYFCLNFIIHGAKITHKKKSCGILFEAVLEISHFTMNFR